MVVVAPYPNGFVLRQTSFNYYFTSTTKKNLSVQDKVAWDHYVNVLEWCQNNLVNYSADLKDILHEGVRVRLGNNEDLAYFSLKWNVTSYT